MIIGLLMVCDENDILAETLARNLEHIDVFYALDGTDPLDVSREICFSTGKCRGYVTDSQLAKPPYPDKPRDGYRRAIHEMAVLDHCPDHWFVLLHGDEVLTFNPDDVIARHPHADGIIFPLPLFVPTAPWDDKRGLEQLRCQLGPGFPELRMFRGREGVHYHPEQHFNVRPEGLRWPIENDDAPILHYPYRAAAVQRARAQRHQETGFDPDNYRHILEHDQVLWTDEMVDAYQINSPYYRELTLAW